MFRLIAVALVVAVVGCADAVVAPVRPLPGVPSLANNFRPFDGFKNATEASQASLSLIAVDPETGDVAGSVSYPDSIHIISFITLGTIGWNGDLTPKQVEFFVLTPGLEALPTYGMFRPTSSAPGEYFVEGRIMFVDRKGAVSYFARDTIRIVQP